MKKAPFHMEKPPYCDTCLIKACCTSYCCEGFNEQNKINGQKAAHRLIRAGILKKMKNGRD